jgi:hypothetical protein
MAIDLKKMAPVSLRDLGLNERWLQDRIQDDTGLLGLGELEIVSREHRQKSGGRIDFLMRDAEVGTYYEVEVMLGSLDESHIIRTIEYWDIERQRRPNAEHRAVIVAENITGRFFNIIRLLNRSVPIIAVQLTAFRLGDGGIGMLPVTVLNISEELEDPDGSETEVVDRAYWEKKTQPQSIQLLDKIYLEAKKSKSAVRLAYTKYYIAIATAEGGYNFCWFYMRAAVGNWMMELRVNETRDSVLTMLVDAGFKATAWGTSYVVFKTTDPQFTAKPDVVTNAVVTAAQESRQ